MKYWKLSEIVTRSWIWLALLIFYLVLIFCVSQLTPNQLQVIPFHYWDKLVHSIEYMPVGFLIAGAIHTRWPDMKVLQFIPLVALIVATLGGLDEFHQSFVSGRDSDANDAVADTIGGIIGATACIGFFKVLRHRTNVAQ